MTASDGAFLGRTLFGGDGRLFRMRIEIELDDTRAQNALQRLIAAGADLSPALRDIGEHILKNTEHRFNTQQDPDGKPWTPLSPTTLKRKRNNRDKILTGRGHLRGNLADQLGRDYVEIGSPFKYANTHQFGARKGAFGKTQRGAPIPWGDIPARPFLGVSGDDRRAINAIITDYIAERWT